MDKRDGSQNEQAGQSGTEDKFLVPEVLSIHLVKFLEDQIIFGEIAPGERFIEDDIVEKYKVSRSPVREALRALEQEGLAQRESRRGVWVTPLSRANLDEVYTCRVALEGLATELAAKNRGTSDLKAIIAALEELDRAYGSGDLKTFFRNNLVLSQKIHAATHNFTVQKLLTSIGKQSLRYRYFAYSREPEMMRASVEGHREIVAAIERQNVRHARTLMEDLIQRSWNVIRKHFV